MNDATLATEAPAATEPVAEITTGKVRGVRIDGVVRFLSIPYAAPPVGERRFLAPAPHPAWPDIRDALVAGASAPQHTPDRIALEGLSLDALIGEGAKPGDDFLAVNVWTPDLAASGLPVMVFIHGGAFLLGSKDAPIYDGAAFARSGVVLVTINYRLGLEGFVHVPGGDTNLGLRDQIAALAWARDNARAFGGDPDNVTVFTGESWPAP